MKETNILFDEFMVKGRTRINHYLNIILWFLSLTGPAIALGVHAKIFLHISYGTCICISLVLLGLSFIHLLMIKIHPESYFTGVFALLTLDMLVVYMSLSHIAINLTWFVVPLLSLAYCDKRMYFSVLLFNYILMFFTCMATASHYANLRIDFNSATHFFLDEMGGFTIETIVMAWSGFLLMKLATDHYKELFRQNEIIKDKENSEQEKLDILNSMAEIYDHVNLLNFNDCTEISIHDDMHDLRKKRHFEPGIQTHTKMNQILKHKIMPDQLEAFLSFTNITTVQRRLTNRKIISADFIDVVSGWFRAEYITVEKDAAGVPTVVIYTTRNVDDEKRREEDLIRLSMTDEMTRLHNRRCLDEDLRKYRSSELGNDFMLMAIDVNGLKSVNDKHGHAAGDELIIGAAGCLALTIRSEGRCYRTGGDEFMAIVSTDDPEGICERIREKVSQWTGNYTKELSVSIGYATHKDYPDASIDELEKIADSAMYAEKQNYYKKTGIDRRRH